MKQKSVSRENLPDDAAIAAALLLGAKFRDPIFTWNGPHYYTQVDRPQASKDMPERTKGEAARAYISRILREKRRHNRRSGSSLLRAPQVTS